MADYTIKQNDTHPPLDATLSDASGPVDLTGATVKLLLKSLGSGTTTLVGDCTLTGALTGQVRYTWVEGDTAAVNTYNGEFEVTWPSLKKTTFPNTGYFTVEIKAELG